MLFFLRLQFIDTLLGQLAIGLGERRVGEQYAVRYNRFENPNPNLSRLILVSI
jgi:hypothetical protein